MSVTAPVVDVPPVVVEDDQPAPVDEHSAPAPVEIFAAPAPVIEYVAQAPAVTYAAPAPVAEHVAPAPAVSFEALARMVENIAPTPVPASPFQVGDMGYDVSSRRHCEIIRLGYGMYKYQIRVLYPHEDRSGWAAGERIFARCFRPDARRTCLTRWRTVKSPGAVYDRAWRACGSSCMAATSTWPSSKSCFGRH